MSLGPVFSHHFSCILWMMSCHLQPRSFFSMFSISVLCLFDIHCVTTDVSNLQWLKRLYFPNLFWLICKNNTNMKNSKSHVVVFSVLFSPPSTFSPNQIQYFGNLCVSQPFPFSNNILHSSSSLATSTVPHITWVSTTTY